MKIIVSACLLGHNCKYNGGNNRNQDIIDFVRNHEVLASCPELLVGLSTPRQPAEIQNGIVTNVAGESVDTPFRKGAQAALEIAIREKAELAILQPRSPSCGCKQIYDGTFSRRLIKGKGIFAQLLSEHGIPAIEPDEVKHHERR